MKLPGESITVNLNRVCFWRLNTRKYVIGTEKNTQKNRFRYSGSENRFSTPCVLGISVEMR